MKSTLCACGPKTEEIGERGLRIGDMAGVVSDAEKSVKLRIEETKTESGKMKILGELSKSSLSTLVGNNVGSKWTAGEEMVSKHNVTSIIHFGIMRESFSKNEMPQNKEHTEVNYSHP